MDPALLADALEALPRNAATLAEARAELARQGAEPSPAAPLAAALGWPTRQKTMVATVHKTTLAASRQRVCLRNQAVLQSAGGPGSGAYLQYPTEAACALEDVEWATGTRCRLLLPRPECSSDELARASATCCNESGAGVRCQAALDENG